MGGPLYIIASDANMSQNRHDHDSEHDAEHDRENDSVLRILNEALRQETSQAQRPPSRDYHPTATR